MQTCMCTIAQSGKTRMLTGVVPAVLRQHPFFGVGGKAEMVHCHLDFSTITSQGEATYRERLEELLRALETWAAGGAAAPARPERPATVTELESAIQLFLKNLRRPVLYTVDEVRDWCWVGCGALRAGAGTCTYDMLISSNMLSTPAPSPYSALRHTHPTTNLHSKHFQHSCLHGT